MAEFAEPCIVQAGKDEGKWAIQPTVVLEFVGIERSLTMQSSKQESRRTSMSVALKTGKDFQVPKTERR